MIIELVINRGLIVEVNGHTSGRFSYDGDDTTFIFSDGLKIAGMTIFKIEIIIVESPDGLAWYGQIHEDFDEYAGLDDVDEFDDDEFGMEEEVLGLPSHIRLRTDKGDFSAAVVACACNEEYVFNKIQDDVHEDFDEYEDLDDEDEFDDEFDNRFMVTLQSGREVDVDEMSCYLRADT